MKNCELINTITPSGGSPIAGLVNSKVTIDATVQTYNTEPYVQRHYDIEPASNAATATATVKLYFTDAEFDNFNNNNPGWLDLPTVAGGGNADPNLPNLKVTQYHGTGTAPGNYTGAAEYLTPTSVIYNATDLRWEVTLTVTGFSGFYVHTGSRPLPISVNYLQGVKQGSVHNLNWKVTCTSSPTATMILERSGDNRIFTAINNITADAVRCAQPFDYVDASPLVGLNYYRLKIIDANGKVTYSNTIAMANTKTGVTIVGIAPNPVTSGGNAMLSVASAQKGMLRLVVTDVTGRQIVVQSQAIIAGSNQIPMNVAKLAAGTYNITAITDDGNRTSVRFVKQ
ncbi:MAG: T9SS type A sorting domain-containing protein [Chitinophagaceae bacterium]|nr:T9SS type A sorting domain-containing protein [Chitinophagaceae bacterium]